MDQEHKIPTETQVCIVMFDKSGSFCRKEEYESKFEPKNESEIIFEAKSKLPSPDWSFTILASKNFAEPFCLFKLVR